MHLAASRRPTSVQFPDPWSEGYYDDKGQVEATRTALPRKITNQKRYHIPGWIAGISVTVKVSKDAGLLITPYPHLILPFCLGRRQMHLGEWQWVIISLTRWWLQLQLVYQFWFHCWSELIHSVVPSIRLVTWKMPFFFSFSWSINQFVFSWKGQ